MRTESMEQFMTDMRRDLEDRLSGIYPGIRVEKQDVDKVQGESYKGLAIRRDDMQIAPVFNVEALYAQMDSQPYGSILNDLVQKAVGIMEKPLNISTEILQDYDFMKGQLMAQIISAKDNAERLEQMPHRQMKDMAVIYRFMVGEDPYGEPMTVAVTNAMLESYGITEAQLHDDAMAAMKMNQPYSIRPLGAVLAEMDPFMDQEMGEVMGPPGLYVATTESKMYGAAVIAQPDFMDNAAGILKGDFYVLPSSLHEVLLLRDDGMTDYRELEGMVRAINEMEVQPADRLTNTVYHYDAGERLFETGKEFEDRMAEKTLWNRESVLADLANQKQKTKEYAPKARSSPQRGGEVL